MAVETLIQFRRGAAATWTSQNPTLSAGEPGFEGDTGKFKIGDGSTAWNSLDYIGDATDLTGGGTIAGDLTVSGNLVVNGTTTTVNSTEMSVDDINIVLGDTASPTDAAADGGGMTLKGSTDKTFVWVDATDAWTSSEHVNIASGKSYYINGSSVLSGTTLGSGVTGSSLTSVGTISSGTWEGTDVGVAHGGTGASDAANARINLGLQIGVDVQAYDADTAKYDAATANFTGTLQNGGSNVVVDSDIGSTVQAYDADTAKYDDTTANFTGTLQNGGSDVVVDSDIGSTVQAYDADLSALAGLTSAANKLPYFTGSGTAALADLSSFGRTLIDDANASVARTTLGLVIGTDVQAYDADTAKYDDVTANFTGTLQNGGSNVVVDSDIGSTVQAYDAELAALAGLTSAANKLPYFTGSGTAALADLSSFGRSIIDDADASAARTTLGLVIGTNVQAYDADTAKYDDTTANFTGTLQNGGSNVLVDSDIGVTVQDYDADLDTVSGGGSPYQFLKMNSAGNAVEWSNAIDGGTP